MKVLLTATVQSHICQFHKPLVQVLHNHGAEVHVAARNNLAEKNGLQLDFVDEVYNISFARSPKSLDNIKAYKELKSLIESGNYDIVHCNTPMGGIITRLAARKVRKSGCKVFYTAHGFHFYQGAPKKNWLFIYPIEKIFAHLTDSLITITKEDYRLARKKFRCNVEYIHGVGANSARFYPIDPGEREKLKTSLGLDSDKKIILNVGELNKNKNQKTVILAMNEVIKEYKDVQLLIAGNGAEEENLRSLIKEHSLENHVKLLGYTTEMEKYMQVSDLLVACSYREGLPVNLMEAMLSGLPVVASKNRGHKELVIPDKTGFLFEAEDVQRLSQYILKLLQNGKLRDKMGKNGLSYVRSFTDENVKNELAEIYGLQVNTKGENP